MGTIAVLVLVRLAGLDTFPLSHPDEGGWPLSVREWVESGQRAGDFYMAPGYHWLLGIPFYLLAPLHSVSRPVSAVISLCTLWLFYRLAARLAGKPAAMGAVLLLGTSYPAVLIDRRALIEPFQIFLITGLCLVAVPFTLPAPGRLRAWRYLAAAALTALLLLTKASGAFILPAIVAALAWPWPGLGGAAWKRRLGITAALVCGVLAAAAVFWWIYTGDPVNFVKAWTRDLNKVNVPGTRPSGGGRFAIHPASIERTIRWYSEYEPVLLGLALLGLLKALWERKHTLMSAWLILGAIFLFIQLYVQENHRAILLPPLCFFAAYLLTELHAMLKMNAPLAAAPRWSWAQAALGMLVLYSLARLGVGLAKTRPAELAATRWLAERTTEKSRVMAAPYVLMRLRAEPVAFWRLKQPFLPTAEQLRRWQPDWLVMEVEEWQTEQEKYGPPEAMRNALAQCCEVAFVTPGATVYRVRKETLARGDN